jgi:membrane-associated phospholipid phosphatase
MGYTQFFIRSLWALWGLLSVIAAPNSSAQGFDYQTLKTISQYHSPADDAFNQFISRTSPPLSIGAPFLMYGIGLIKKDKDLKHKSVNIGIALALTLGETYVLKKAINRPRPYITYPDLRRLSTENTASMPSGHTSAAFSIATSLTLNYPRWYVAIPAYAWATATGYSRLYLGVHYPTDVLAGAALGSATAWLSWKVNKKWQAQKQKMTIPTE